MTARRRSGGGGSRRPFADPLDPFNKRPRRASRHQQRLEEAERRQQARRHVSRLAAEHDAPPQRQWALYVVLTVAITLIGWRMLHWFVWFSSLRRLSGGGAIVGRSGRDIIAAGFENQPEPAAWIDPVGLAAGLTLGLLITWVYARYFQNL